MRDRVLRCIGTTTIAVRLARRLSIPSCDSPMTAATPTDDAPFRKFMCVVCGWIYDEAEGWPDDGIAPGTRWEDVPETWTCPDCGVTKSDFEMLESRD
jgi:rubredoxin